MKRYLSQLLQQPRARFESSSAARQDQTPQILATDSGLHTADGYDWLHQIKPPQHAHRPATS